MNDIASALSALYSCKTVSGSEEGLLDFIRETLPEPSRQVTRDTLGNVTVYCPCGKPGAKRLLVTAPADEFGFIVTYIDPDGKIRLHAQGTGVSLAPLYGLSAVCGEETGVLLSEKDPAEAGEDDFYLDTGASDAGEIAAVQGDLVWINRPPVVLRNDRLCLSGMGGKALCLCLTEVARLAMRLSFDVYYVFAAQNRLGARGAKAAAETLRPDIAVSLDLYPAGDTKVGKGPVIYAADAAGRATLSVVESLKKAAESIGISYQVSAKKHKTVPSALTSFAAAGAQTGILGLPCEKFDTVQQISEKDLKSMSALLSAYLIFEDETITGGETPLPEKEKEE